MKPTLEIGDRFYVQIPVSFPFDEILRTYSPEQMPRVKVRRGDVVTFKAPTDPPIDYVKRVVGLPGETIQMKAGLLHINGEPILRERLDDYSDHSRTNGSTSVARYQETLPNGVHYETLDLTESGMLDDTREYLVPEGHYFVLGDNRDNSIDSRVLARIGYIPAENLIGVASHVYFSGPSRRFVWRSMKPGLD